MIRRALLLVLVAALCVVPHVSHAGWPGRFSYVPRSAATTPLTIFGASNVLAWYRSDLGITTNGAGTTVAEWADQSGNGINLLQATAGLQPGYTTNGSGINGRPTLSFLASQYLIATATSMLASGSRPSIFLVMKNSTTLAGGSFLDVSNGTTPITGVFTSTTKYETYLQRADGLDVINGANIDTSAHHFEAHFTTDSTWSFVKDGAATTSTHTGATASAINQIVVGQSRGLNSAGNGQVSEIVITKSVPTSGNKSSMETYVRGLYATP